MSDDVNARRRRPRMSGKFAALWMTLGLVLTALVIPTALRLPMWVEWEIVLAVWWAVWFAVLTRFLYAGTRLTDDHRWSPPRAWISSDNLRAADGCADGCIWLPIEAEGCGFLLALVAIIAAAWFLIEIAVPALVLLVYVVARGMLAHVANDTHHCRGHIGRSIAWAAIWATAYTAPYAGAVWLIHAIHAARPHVG